MITLQEQPMRCPRCGQEQVAVTETIEAWQWERPVYGCSACTATFVGSWRATDESVTPDVAAPPIEAIAHAV